MALKLALYVLTVSYFYLCYPWKRWGVILEGEIAVYFYEVYMDRNM